MKAATAVTKMSGGTTAERRFGRDCMPQGVQAISGKNQRFRRYLDILPPPPRAGTVHAPQASGSQRQLPRNWWLSVISACLFTSCVVLPPTADPPAEVPPILKIEKVDPDPLEPKLVLEPSKGQPFSIAGVTSQGLDPANLHYYWYYDYKSQSGVLDAFATCQNKPTCSVFICEHAKSKNEFHTLLAVVSSAPLIADAVNPTDFPTSTVYDSLQWQIDNQGGCVVSP